MSHSNSVTFEESTTVISGLGIKVTEGRREEGVELDKNGLPGELLAFKFRWMRVGEKHQHIMFRKAKSKSRKNQVKFKKPGILPGFLRIKS